MGSSVSLINDVQFQNGLKTPYFQQFRVPLDDPENFSLRMLMSLIWPYLMGENGYADEIGTWNNTFAHCIRFRKIIQERWPPSKIEPRGANESDANFAMRTQQWRVDYDEFIKYCYNQIVFVRGRENVNLPYTPQVNNIPPSIRLKNPINVPGPTWPPLGGPLDSRNQALMIRAYIHMIASQKPMIESLQKKFDVNYNPPRNVYNVYENLFMQNCLFFSQDDLTNINVNTTIAEDMDFTEMTYKEFFTTMWPKPVIHRFPINASESKIPQEQRSSAYNEWVQRNYELYIHSGKSLLTYENWPLPYTFPSDEDAAKGVNGKNVPNIIAQLQDGHLRTQTLIAYFGSIANAANYWMNMRRNSMPHTVQQALDDPTIIYFPLREWSNIATRLTTSQAQPFSLFSKLYRVRADDPNEITFENPIFGDRGASGYYYPLNWPLPATPTIADELKSEFGLHAFLPPPCELSGQTYLALGSSGTLHEPSVNIKKLWQSLFDTFALDNPLLFVDLKVDTLANENSGFPSPEFLVPNRPPQEYEAQNLLFTLKQFNNTSSLRSINLQLTPAAKQELHMFINQNFPDFVNFSAIDKVSQFDIPGNIGNNLREWADAIYLIIHLRLAYRHYYYPGEEFIKAEMPLTLSLDILNTNLPTVNWLKNTWASEFITSAQKEAQNMRLFPKPGAPNQYYTMDWTTMYIMLYWCQQFQKSGASKTNLPEWTRFPHPVREHFKITIFHRYQEVFIYPKNNFEDPMAPLIDAIAQIIDETNSQKDWDFLASYLAMQMYFALIEDNQFPIRKLGEFPIDPRIPLSLDAQALDNFSMDLINPNIPKTTKIWNFWKEQWLISEKYSNYPTYRKDDDGNLIVVEQATPLPAFYVKLWNTYMSWFINDTKPLGKDLRRTDSFNDDLITGFVLPPNMVIDAEIYYLYLFVRKNNLPPVKEKPIFYLEGQEAWEDAKALQWEAYREWCEANVACQLGNAPNYVFPGSPLRNKDGSIATVKNDKNEPITAFNRYVSYGVCKTPLNDGTSFSWIFDIGELPANLTGVKTWHELIRKTMKEVVDILHSLLEAIPTSDIVKVLLIGGGALAAFLLARMALTAEPKTIKAQ